jgi:CBS domain containing-hemolysin-like protein
MNDYHSYYLILTASLVILLCLSAFFSASEMAFTSLNRIKLKSLAEKNKRARLALKLLETYDKLLSSVLIGNNLVNIAASAIATAMFIRIFDSKGMGVTYATITITLLVLIFSEITPKTLAKETPEVTALRSAPLLSFFIFIFTPFNFLFAQWKKLIMKIFPVKNNRSTTEDEFLTFVEEVRQEGGINKQEEEMIRQVIEFDDVKVHEIFTPRIDVAAVSINSEVDEVKRIFTESGYSRLPVYRDTIDNIFGIILWKDFHNDVENGMKSLSDIVRPTIFVPGTTKISNLLKTLQKKQTHMAVILDEHGGTLGIVTIEDILEELVGEIWDEHDEVIEPVKMIENGVFTVIAGINFDDMLEEKTKKGLNIKIDMPEEKEIPDTTVANFLM